MKQILFPLLVKLFAISTFTLTTISSIHASDDYHFLRWSNAMPTSHDGIIKEDLPAVFLVTGGGSYCESEPGLTVGLEGSETGVTYTLVQNGINIISTQTGTGSSLSFGLQPEGTYTIEGSNTSGTIGMSGSAVIVSQTPANPLFVPIGPLCLGSTPPSLPLTSINGISGSWSPSSINTGIAGTECYLFTPDPGQCSNPFSMCISIVNPSGSVELYGMTSKGGANNKGVIFSINPLSKVQTVEYSMASETGSEPHGSLLYLDGKLHGMTMLGGTLSCGVIFEWNLQTSLYLKTFDFNPWDNAMTSVKPTGSLIYTDGFFYGHASEGPSPGSLFRWDPSNQIMQNLKSFEPPTSSEYPYGTPILFNGKLFGLVSGYPGYTNGEIFDYNLVSNTYSRRHRFTSDGAFPYGSLCAYGEKLYGMTGGGTTGGNIFEWNPETNYLMSKIVFNGSEQGASPYGTLTLFNGKFYGLAAAGGANNMGTLFEWDPQTNVFTKKIDFNGIDRGSSPMGSLTFCYGKAYGMTNTGGINNMGTIFEWDPMTGVFTKLLDFNGTNGANPKYTHLTVVGTPPVSQTIQACSQYTWPVNNQSYTHSGLFYATLSSVSGCDSVIELNLTIHDPVTSTSTVTACEEYSWNGTAYFQSGIYSAFFENGSIFGCDSTAVLNLVIYQPQNSVTAITACSPYTWNGNQYTQSGTYSISFPAAASSGQDSTAILILNKLPAVQDEISGPVSTCAGASATFSTSPGYTSYNWTVSGDHTIIENNGSSLTLAWNTPGNYDVSVTISDLGLCSSTIGMPSSVLVIAGKPLLIKGFLEGLYAGSSTMNQAMDESGAHFASPFADEITIELHDPLNYGVICFAIPGVRLNTQGMAEAFVPDTLSGSYYLTLRNRNHIETTSSVPVSFSASAVSYDFSQNSGSSFGGNLLDKSGVFVFKAGDENQDRIVDASDMIDIDNQAQDFVSGYVDADLNGDGIVDSGDMILADNHANSLTAAILPPGIQLTLTGVSMVTSASALAEAQLLSEGDTPVAERGFCYNTKPDPDFSDFSLPAGSGIGTFSVALAALSPYTRYYIRAYARNASDTCYSNQVTFITLPDPEKPTVITSELLSTSSSSAIAAGEVISEGSSPVSSRGFCWATHPNPCIPDSFILNGSGMGTYNSLISGITPNDSCYIRSFAINQTDTAYGRTLSFLPVLESPAVYSIGNGNSCSAAEIHGIFSAYYPLTLEEYLTIQVEVAVPGSYEIASDTLNGYYFSACGLFSTPGTQTIRLQAYGTPITGQTDTFFLHAFGCGGDCSFNVPVQYGKPCPGIPTVNYTGRNYHTVLIGNQCWLKENIVQVGNCYDFINTNCDLFGSIGTSCPTGWHIPSKTEWETLVNFIGGYNAGGKLKSTGIFEEQTGLWFSPNSGATNETGFTATPGGQRHYFTTFSSPFYGAGYQSTFLTSTYGNGNNSKFHVILFSDSGSITIAEDYYYYRYGYYTRCIKD